MLANRSRFRFGGNAVGIVRRRWHILTRRIPADLSSSASSFGYGFLAQIASAATNFGLVVLAARALGPSGLGTISVGLAACIVLFGVQRGLLINPLVARTAACDVEERAVTAYLSLMLALVGATLAAASLTAIGLALPSQLAQGILLFAPWVVPFLLQDLARSVLFRDGQGKTAALASLTWLLVMAVTAPIAFATHSAWAITGSWGLGSIAAAIVALPRIHYKRSPFIAAREWWKTQAWPFARWMLLSGTLYHLASYASVIALVTLLGASDFGGLRAIQSVFAPLTLIGPADCVARASSHITRPEHIAPARA